MNLFERLFTSRKARELETLQAELQSQLEQLIDAGQWHIISAATGNDIYEQVMRELDPQLIDMYIRRGQYITGLGAATEQDRSATVAESRRLASWDVIAQTLISLVTNYAFDTSPEVSTEDVKAQPYWDAFWKAPGNDPVLGMRSIQTLSWQLLTDGEIGFLVYISRLDGQATVRTVTTERIVDIITIPEDPKTPAYYHVSYTKSVSAEQVDYYVRDWRLTEKQAAKIALPEGAIRAERMRSGRQGTDVVMLFVANRVRPGEMRGWPLLSAAIPWIRLYSRFLNDRAAVAAAAAAFVEKITVQGGSRAVDAVRNYIDTTLRNPSTGTGTERNPPPVAGSTWIQNNALDKKWESRPTNAGDAESDGLAILNMAGLGAQVYPHYLGRGDYYRLATATQMERPMLLAFNAYQLLWASVWRDLAQIVLAAAETFNLANFASLDVQVNLDAVILSDIDQLEKVMKMTDSAAASGSITAAEAHQMTRSILRLAIQTIGIRNAGNLVPVKQPKTTKGTTQDGSPI